MSLLDELFNEYQQLKQRIAELEQSNAALNEKLKEQEKSINDRFKELATLTKMVEERDQALHEAQRRIGSVTMPAAATPTASSGAAPAAKPAQQFSEAETQVMIEKSGVFDKQWYLTQYVDVAQSGMDPIEHYVLFGAKELRNPSSQFNTAHYLQRNPSLASSKINPLLHYITTKQLA